MLRCGFYDIAEMQMHWHKYQVRSITTAAGTISSRKENRQIRRAFNRRAGGLAAGNQKLMMGRGTAKLKSDLSANSTITRLTKRCGGLRLLAARTRSWPKRRCVYYVMGDVSDPKAPGNEWRTPSWPAPSKPVSYFLMQAAA